MALVKTRPLSMLRPDFDRIVDRLMDWELAPFTPREEPAAFGTTWEPDYDLTETDDAYQLRMDVPGIPKENLDVILDGNVLTVSGRREMAVKEEDEKLVWQERRIGKFVRSLRLPTPVLEVKIKAHVDNGVLSLFLPKAEPATKSRILIK